MEHEKQEHTQDPVEKVVHHMHLILPLAGAVLSFMLICIAITVA